MKVLPGRIGTIRMELKGRSCSSCGSNEYQLILRCGLEHRRNRLDVRCRRCSTRRELEEADLQSAERELRSFGQCLPKKA